jgi:ABC transporter substrate binding protein
MLRSSCTLRRDGHETTGIYYFCWECRGRLPAKSACAAAGNTTPDSDFSSCNPDDPPDRNWWGQRMARVFRRTTPLGLRRRRKSDHRTLFRRRTPRALRRHRPGDRDAQAGCNRHWDKPGRDRLQRRNQEPVVAFMLDPLHAGLVTNLSRPAGNLTGITLDPGIEVWGKRLEILKEAIPSTAKAAFLGMRGGWEGSSGQVLRDAASRLSISLVFTLPEKGTPLEIERAFAEIEQQRPDALLVSGEGDLYANRQLIAELSVKKRLPAMCPYRDHVEAGALMGYAVDLAELLRRMADDVHQILKGAKPGDIPIYQPTKFELLINLNTAKTLGLTLPRELLTRADELIE